MALTANNNTTITDAQAALANQNAIVIPPSAQLQPTNLQVAKVIVNDPSTAAAAAAEAAAAAITA